MLYRLGQGGGGMGDDFGLVSLDGLGDPEQLRQRAHDELAGLELDTRPGAHQQGEDPSRSVWVTVADDGEVADVSISRQWVDRLSTAQLGDAVLAAYRQANQKRAAVLGRAGTAAGPGESRYDATMPDIDDERWMSWVWESLGAARRRLDELSAGHAPPPGHERTVEGPGGYVRLRATGPAVTAVLIDAVHVAERSPDLVAVDLRAAFAEVRRELLDDSRPY
jgi:hypothetical protein